MKLPPFVGRRERERPAWWTLFSYRGELMDANQPNLKIKQMRVEELTPYIGNAKKHPEWQVEQIKNSIVAFGFNDPIAVWEDIAGHLIIVEGHGRLMAAKELGMEKVPVIRLDHLDDEGRRAYTLAHNKLTMNTDFDALMLDFELGAIEGFDMSEFGFEAEMPGIDGGAPEREGVAVTVRFPDQGSYEAHRPAFSAMEEGGATVAVSGAE